MAIHPFILDPAPVAPIMVPAHVADIEAWTEQATEALQSVSLSGPPPRVTRGTSVTMSIPLDGARAVLEENTEDATSTAPRVTLATNNAYGRREPMRRDSLKRRESVLKGKEGSRQRRRWENDRLLNNPWAQPPQPMDWEVRPTHRKRNIPYYLAPMWDEEVAQKRKTEQRRKRFHGGRAEETDPASQIPKEVRAKLKRAKAAKGMLQDLEEDVRVFVQRWNEKHALRQQDGLEDADSDEDEIVFVGRNGQMHDFPARKKIHEDLRREKLVLDTLAEDRGASFGRWLVHSIATYYGLRTWSVTVGDPARREAYVGIAEDMKPLSAMSTLPRPLWGMV